MRRALICLAVLTLAGSACSKSSVDTLASPRPSSASATAAQAKAPVALPGKVNNHGTKDITGAGSSPGLELEQDNFYFAPTFVKASPGAKVKIELKNEGSVPHTFTIDALKVNQTLDPDKQKEVLLTLPSSGVVNFYCRFHRSQGMQGAFYFVLAKTTTPQPTAAAAQTTKAPVTSSAPSMHQTSQPTQRPSGNDYTPAPSTGPATPYVPYPGGPGY